MLNAVLKIWHQLFGAGADGPKLIFSSETCPECGSRLCRRLNLSSSADGGEGRDEEVLPPSENKPFHGESRSGASHQGEAEIWRCPNLDCPAQVRANLVHWCSPEAMDIPGGNAEFVATLVSRGLARDVADLYRLKVKELAALPGIDKESAQQFFDALTASLKRDAWRLLFGLAIPGFTAVDAQLLCRNFGAVDYVLDASLDRLQQVDGVSETAARNLVRWYGDPVNRRLVRRLLKLKLNFKA